MTETINIFGKLSNAEFNQMINAIASPDFHALPMAAFAALTLKPPTKPC